MIYYLGELARIKIEYECKGQEWSLMPKVKGDPLLNLKLAKDDLEDSYLSVGFQDETYYLPKSGRSGRSLQALALIAQLLALHQESDELPKTNAVEITGG